MILPNNWERLQILGTFPQSVAGKWLEIYYYFSFHPLTFGISKNKSRTQKTKES